MPLPQPFKFDLPNMTERASTPSSCQRPASPTQTSGTGFVSRPSEPEPEQASMFVYVRPDLVTPNISRPNLGGVAPPQAAQKKAAPREDMNIVAQQSTRPKEDRSHAAKGANRTTSPQSPASPTELKPQQHIPSDPNIDLAHPQPRRPAVSSKLVSSQQPDIDTEDISPPPPRARLNHESARQAPRAQNEESDTGRVETGTTKTPGPAMSSATKGGQAVSRRSPSSNRQPAQVHEHEYRSSPELEAPQDVRPSIEAPESEQDIVHDHASRHGAEAEEGHDILKDKPVLNKDISDLKQPVRSASTLPVVKVVPAKDHEKEIEGPVQHVAPQHRSRLKQHPTALAKTDGNKVQKSRPKPKQHNAMQGQKQHNGMTAPTTYRSQDLFQLYQLTLESERAQSLQQLTTNLREKEISIHKLRLQNEELLGTLTSYEEANASLRETYEKQETRLRSYSEKVRKFAGYMTKLDTDFPLLRKQHKVLCSELKDHVSVNYNQIKEDIAKSRSSISGVQAHYTTIINTLRSELVRADEHAQDLKRQLSDNAGQLAEEKYRCQSFEKQLKSAAESKDDILQHLTKLQGQCSSLESLVEKCATRDEDQTATALETIMDMLEETSSADDVQNRMQKLEETIKQLHDSHSSRLEDMSKAQADVFANDNPLEQRLKDSIAKIAQNFGDLQSLQARNETLHGENAKLGQQVEHVNEQLADLLKEKRGLVASRTTLEEQLKKSGEDIAGLRERLMTVANTTNIQESLQIGILQTENFKLNQEAEHIREVNKQYNDAKDGLLQQIGKLKAQVESNGKRVGELQQASSLSEQEWQKKLVDAVKKAKEEFRLSFEALKKKDHGQHENYKKQARTEKEGLKTQLQEKVHELAALKEEVDALQEAKKKLESSLQREQEATTEADNKVEQLGNEIASLNKAIANHEQAATDHEANIADLKKEIEDLKKSKTTQISEYNKLDEEHKQLKTKVSKLENEILSCKTSFDAKERALQQQSESAKIEAQRKIQAAETAIKNTETSLEEERSRTQNIRKQLESLQHAKDEAYRSTEEQLSDLRTQAQVQAEVLEAARKSEKQLQAKLAATQLNANNLDGTAPSTQHMQSSANKVASSQTPARAQVQVGDSQTQSTQASGLGTQSTYAGLPNFAPEALEETEYSYVQDLDPRLLSLESRTQTQRTAVEETQLTQERDKAVSQKRAASVSSPLSEPPESSPDRHTKQNGISASKHVDARKSTTRSNSRISGPAELLSQEQSAPKARPASNTGAARSVTPAGDVRRSGSNVRFAEDDRDARSHSSQNISSSPLSGRQPGFSQLSGSQGSQRVSQSRIEVPRSQSSTQSRSSQISQSQVIKSSMKKRKSNEELESVPIKRTKTGISTTSTTRSSGTATSTARSSTTSSTGAGAVAKTTRSSGQLKVPQSKIRGSEGHAYGTPNTTTRTPSSRSGRSSSTGQWT